jgi:small subunit ribosomal protein S9
MATPAEPAQYQGTGKRKTSVARVILRPGDGATWFNAKTAEEYFPRLAHRELALSPLKVAGVEGTFDVRVRVHGGGPSGQAGARRPASTRHAKRPSSLSDESLAFTAC